MEPTESQQARMQKALCYELGMMTKGEELAYLKELIERHPDLAADYIEGVK